MCRSCRRARGCANSRQGRTRGVGLSERRFGAALPAVWSSFWTFVGLSCWESRPPCGLQVAGGGGHERSWTEPIVCLSSQQVLGRLDESRSCAYRANSYERNESRSCANKMSAGVGEFEARRRLHESRPCRTRRPRSVLRSMKLIQKHNGMRHSGLNKSAIMSSGGSERSSVDHRCQLQVARAVRGNTQWPLRDNHFAPLEATVTARLPRHGP